MRRPSSRRRCGRARRVFAATKSLSRKTPVVETSRRRRRNAARDHSDECVEHTPRESVIALVAAPARNPRPTSSPSAAARRSIRSRSPCSAWKSARRPRRISTIGTRVKADGSREIPAVPMGKVRQIAIPTTCPARNSAIRRLHRRRAGHQAGFTAPRRLSCRRRARSGLHGLHPERLWFRRRPFRRPRGRGHLLDQRPAD